MEVAAAETTVDFSVFITDTKISPTVLTIEIPGTTGGDQESTCLFKMSVNGEGVNGGGDLTALFTTSWVFDATTLSLSLGSRSTAFKFTGATSTEITIPAEHTHVTVNGVETYVNLPEIVTTIEVTESTNVIVDLPEVTTTLEIPAETFELTVTPFTITTGDEASGQDTGSSYCGSLEISAGAAYSGGHIVHGCANAMYLPKVIKYNAKDETAAKRYADIARFIHLKGETTDELVNHRRERIQ